MFPYLCLVLLILLGCSGRQHIKPGLSIKDEPVGLVVVNYWLHPDRKSEKVREFDEQLARIFEKELAANTLYRLKLIDPVNIENFSAKYMGKLFARDLLNEPQYLDEIVSIAKSSQVDFMVLIFIEKFESRIGEMQPNVSVVVQILDVANRSVVFNESVKAAFDIGIFEKVVSKFPGYFSRETGDDPAKKFVWINPDSMWLPEQSDYPEAGAVFLVDEAGINVQMKPGNIFTSFTKYGNVYSTETFHVAIKILNERGYKYADVEIPFSHQVHLENIEARTIAKDGQVIFLTEDQIHEVTLFPEYVFFSDLKAKKFTMPGVEPGCIVEYRYQSTVESPSLWGLWSFGHADPVLRSTFAMDIPRGLEYKVFFNCPEYMPERIRQKADSLEYWKKSGGYREGHFSREPRLTREYVLYDLPGLEMEKGMPPLSEIVPQLKFCSATFAGFPYLTSWADLSSWYREYIEDSFKASRGMKKQAQSLTHGLETEEEKARAIYRFVRDNTRYVAIHLGMGAIIPQKATEVFQQKYGDCKGFSALLISMLLAAGIDGSPAILRTKDLGALDESYVSLSQFNHMIVCAQIDSQLVWLDPTAGICPFGQLPWQDQGTQALVLREEEQEFTSVPTSQVENNIVRRKIQIQPLEQGSIHIVGEVHFEGQEAFPWRAHLKNRNPSQRVDLVHEYITTSYSGAKLLKCSHSAVDSLSQPLCVHFECEIPHYMTYTSDLLILKPGLLCEREKYDHTSERIHPFVFDYPQKTVDEMRIAVPDGYIVKRLPQPQIVDSRFGKFKLEYMDMGEFIQHSREFSVTAERIPADMMSYFLSFMDKIASADQEQIVFEKAI